MKLYPGLKCLNHKTSFFLVRYMLILLWAMFVSNGIMKVSEQIMHDKINMVIRNNSTINLIPVTNLYPNKSVNLL